MAEKLISLLNGILPIILICGIPAVVAGIFEWVDGRWSRKENRSYRRMFE